MIKGSSRHILFPQAAAKINMQAWPHICLALVESFYGFSGVSTIEISACKLKWQDFYHRLFACDKSLFFFTAKSAAFGGRVLRAELPGCIGPLYVAEPRAVRHERLLWNRR